MHQESTMNADRLSTDAGASQNTILYAVGLAVLLFAARGLLIAVQRLLVSDLAGFPGPRLAALTNWYEFYYDVILQGQFTAHIQELHRQYGPIVRITPTELHIDDPEYFDTLYSRAGRRDKSPYFAGRFGYASDSFSTVDHEQHRMRRKAISPFFSAAKIADFNPVIYDKVDKLCQKLTDHSDGQVIQLSRAWMALTTDIITEYSFAKSYDQLDSPNFDETLHEALVAIYTVGHLALHFSFIFPILDRLPEWLVRKAKPEILSVVGLRKDLARRISEIRKGINQGHKNASHPTIFHELLLSDLPEDEKTDARLGDEAQLIVAAGLITTSWALSVASFHLCRDAKALGKLRDELRGAQLSPREDWRQLEKLPYLNACVQESIRLSHGIVTRDPRLAPDTDLQYGQWTIPKNTPVSMTTVDVLMNEDIFPEPESFVPERWIERPELQRYFVPFGKGSRQCIGIKLVSTPSSWISLLMTVSLAMAELYITIATVFTRFDFDLFQTDESDVRMAHAYLVPYTKWESKGIRVTVRNDMGA